MRTNWTEFKNFLKDYDQQERLYLSIINEEGYLLNANARMIQTFQLDNPRGKKVDFINLIHPVNQENFRNVLNHCRLKGVVGSTELYLKNGHYQPMKWQVIPFNDQYDNSQHFLCAGYKLPESKRQRKFAALGARHYQHVIEGLDEGILLQETNGDIISASQRTAEIFGTTLEKIYEISDIRNKWNTEWKITDANGNKLLFDDTPFMKTAASGKLCEGEMKVCLRNEEIRQFHFRSQPLLDDEKRKVCAIVSSIRDITHQQKLTEQLQQREKLFIDFMYNSPNLAWVVDEDATLVVASKAFYEHFQIDPVKAEGKNAKDLMPAQVFASLYEKHARVISTGVPLSLIEKMNWVDGTQFVFHISIFPFEGSGGKKMLGGQAVNMIEKYTIEKQLRETNERLLLMTRAASDSIWEWDMQTGYIFRNDALMDMIGYPQEETRGLSWWLRRIHPEDRNRVSDRVKEVTDAGRQSWEEEYRFKCADGTYKHMLDKGFVVYENGLPIRMIGSLHDITEMKKLENELVLEKMNLQKTVSETAIRVQEKERTRIGHELHDNVNQILSTTKLFVDMLTPGTEEEMQIKEKSVGYLMMAIDEIRKLSKELVTPSLQEIGLIRSIQQLVDDFCYTTKLNIRFTHDLETDMLDYGMQITLFRICQEQLKNIIVHSQAANVDILLQRRHTVVNLIIRDDGKGFNIKQTSKGIGIANIHNRAKYYNGDVQLRSAPGEGCILEVSLPFETGQGEEA